MKRFLILSLVVLSSIFSIEVSSASDWQLAVSLSEGYVSLFTFDGSVLSLADQKKETASAGFIVTRFNPVAPFLVTGAAGSNWSIWNVASNTLVKTYFSGSMPMISASWHPSGTRLAIYTLVGFVPQLHVYSFDILTGLPTLIVSFNVQANPVFPRGNFMAWDKTGEYIALGLDAAVDVWQLRVYKYDDMASSLIPAGGMSIPQHYTLTGLDWGPNGQYILLGQDANTLPITYPYANVIEYQPNLITPNAPTFISKFNNFSPTTTIRRGIISPQWNANGVCFTFMATTAFTNDVFIASYDEFNAQAPIESVSVPLEGPNFATRWFPDSEYIAYTSNAAMNGPVRLLLNPLQAASDSCYSFISPTPDFSIDIPNSMGGSSIRVDGALDVRAVSTTLEIDKSVDTPVTYAGQTVTFTITVTNNSLVTAVGVLVNDLLPSGLTFAGAVVSQGSYNSGSGDWSVGNLVAGASATLELSATVDAAAAGQTLENIATLGADTASAIVEVLPNQSSLLLELFVDDDTPTGGQEVVFTITVANNGGAEAKNRSLKFLRALSDYGLDIFPLVQNFLPEGFTFISRELTQGEFDSGSEIWDIGSLPPDFEATLQIRAQVPIVSFAQIFTNRTQLFGAYDSNIIDAFDELDLLVLPNMVEPGGKLVWNLMAAGANLLNVTIN